MADTAINKVLNIKIEYSQAIKRLAELEKQMVNLKDKLKDLNSAETKDDAWAREMARNKQAMKDVTDESNRLTKQIQSQINEEHKGIKSILEMTQNLDILTKKYKGLSEAERESSVGKKLLNEIGALSQNIKEASRPLDVLTGKFKEFDSSLNGQKARLAALVKEYENYTKAERKIYGKDTLNTIKQVTENIKKQEQELNRAKKGFSNVNGSVNDLRARLNELIRQFDWKIRRALTPCTGCA